MWESRGVPADSFTRETRMIFGSKARYVFSDVSKSQMKLPQNKVLVRIGGKNVPCRFLRESR